MDVRLTPRASRQRLSAGPYRLMRPVLLMAMVAAAATMYVMISAGTDAGREAER